MSTKNILIATLSGIAAGVIVGYLTAPASGSETRQKLSDTADDLKRRFKRMQGVGEEELEELKEIFEKEMKGVKASVKEKVLKLIEAAKANGTHVMEEAAN